MHPTKFLLLTFCCACLPLATAIAQPPERSNQRRPGQGRGPGAGGQGMNGARQGPGARGAQQTPPLLRVFDVDGSGSLSKSEIDNAAIELRKLDMNQDGELTAEELRPQGQPQGGPGQRGSQTQRGSQPQRGQSQRGGPGTGGGPGGPGRGGPPGGANARGGANTRGGMGPGGGGRGGDPAQADAAFADQVKSLDQNRDGKISIAELPEHMHNAFQIADADKNQSLDPEELLVLASQFRRNRLNPNADAKIKNAPVQSGSTRPDRPQ